MIETSTPRFGSVRSFFWPVQKQEASKLIPMMLILFLICFGYNVLRTIKDAVIVTAAGAEVIPFLKVWGILPGALLITLLFTKLSNRISQERIFYFMISGFLLAFALLTFVLYPLRDLIHLDTVADTLSLYLPVGAKGFISMVRYWSYSLFYILAELWGSMIMSVLFWGFANEVMRLDEARRFYGLLGVAANFSGLVAGAVGAYCSQGTFINPSIPFGNSGWEQTMMLSISVVILTGILTMAIFRWMNCKVLNAPRYRELHSSIRQKPQKRKLSLRESILFLSRSRYLLYIAVIVIAYNLTLNLVEVVWKDQLYRLYPSPVDYNAFMSYSIILTGIVSTISAWLVPGLISRFGWTVTALTTPVVMLVTCIGFFSFFFFQEHLGGITFAFMGATPLAIAVYFGAAQNILSRASKYTVFDSTKEMSFIPLDHETKLKGKAAIDGVGSRFGKSGGALIHQGLLLFFGSLTYSAPYIAAVLFFAIILWIIAARLLGKQFNLAAAATTEPTEIKGSSNALQTEQPFPLVNRKQLAGCQ